MPRRRRKVVKMRMGGRVRRRSVLVEGEGEGEVLGVEEEVGGGSGVVAIGVEDTAFITEGGSGMVEAREAWRMRGWVWWSRGLAEGAVFGVFLAIDVALTWTISSPDEVTRVTMEICMLDTTSNPSAVVCATEEAFIVTKKDARDCVGF